MADLSITTSDVVTVSGSLRRGTSGAAITAGQALYKDSDGKYQPADASAEATAVIAGVALNSAPGVDQPVTLQVDGVVDLGTGTEGVVYVVSATAGGIAPVSDLVATDYVGVVGVGLASSQVRLSLNASGAQVQ